MDLVSSEFHEVIIVGAGLSGIGAACHLQQALPGTDFLILEGRDRLGGTWDLFRYPGIRSDSDMHTLGYRFKPWTEAKAIADGPSILRYLQETSAEHDVDRYIRYRHQLRKAEWSSDDNTWTLHVDVGEDEAPRRLRCRFLLMCAGYYSYEHGHTPEFAGRERFEGPVVHPQYWPQDLDYDGKRVVIIGSGATAVTLLPELSKRAEHVVMLQRSPTYMISFPDEDFIANTLRKLLPDMLAYRITRWKNIRMQKFIFRIARKRPGLVRRLLVRHARKVLGPDYDVDRHFNPSYDPWEQRLCLVPNDDLFEAIASGSASVVTDHIETFTDKGILLESGKELEADIIVTATGLDIVTLGNVDFAVDGNAVDFSKRFAYKGIMMEGVPNMVTTFGYINASWTLRADLVAQYTCRLLSFMRDNDVATCTPKLRPEDEGMQPQHWVTGFSSGYLQRELDRLPKQGDREPWLNPQDYLGDRRRFLREPLDDGALVFSPGRWKPAD